MKLELKFRDYQRNLPFLNYISITTKNCCKIAYTTITKKKLVSKKNKGVFSIAYIFYFYAFEGEKGCIILFGLSANLLSPEK